MIHSHSSPPSSSSLQAAAASAAAALINFRARFPMEEPPFSPNNARCRLKFLCCYGGRILPRPSDALLRYVGGETRVLSVPRSITFAELKERIACMFNADLAVKYQLLAEDLDALVSVKNDEDLYYMVDEYDRFDRRPCSPTIASSPRFRLFLFPSTAAAVDPASPANQRYVDAINNGQLIPSLPPHNQLFTISSAGTSPTSPDSLNVAAAAGSVSAVDPSSTLRINIGRGGGGGGVGMHRVRSTPNLGAGRGNGGSQTSSPRAYKRPTAPIGGGPGWRVGGGGFRQEVGLGCWCSCGCSCCTAQQMRKYMCSSQPLAASSPPSRGSQEFHLGPPPQSAATLRRVAWE